MGKAQNAFLHERYEKIISHIRGIEYEYFNHKERALKIELITIYMDRKNNYSLLRSFIHNYKRTLKRNNDQLDVNNYPSNYNFVNVIEEVVHIVFRRITVKLEKYEFLACRTWLKGEVERRKP